MNVLAARPKISCAPLEIFSIKGNMMTTNNYAGPRCRATLSLWFTLTLAVMCFVSLSSTSSTSSTIFAQGVHQEPFTDFVRDDRAGGAAQIEVDANRSAGFTVP